MKGKVLKSFVDGRYGSKGMNSIIEIPEGVDWVKAGFVEPILDEIENAAITPPKRAVRKTRKPRKPRAKKKAAN